MVARLEQEAKRRAEKKTALSGDNATLPDVTRLIDSEICVWAVEDNGLIHRRWRELVQSLWNSAKDFGQAGTRWSDLLPFRMRWGAAGVGSGG